MKGIIYKYTNKLNGKVYIGQTRHEKRRINEHRTHPFNKNCSDYDYLFHRAIRKDGWENFTYEILFKIDCSDTEVLTNILNEEEIKYIAIYNSNDPEKGYNETKGGSGYPWNKIGNSTWNISRKEFYAKKSKSLLGNHNSDGKHPNSHQTPDEKEKSKMAYNKVKYNVLCIETGVIYESSHEIERLLNLPHQNIDSACLRKGTCGGYHWERIPVEKKDVNQYLDVNKTIKENMEYLFSQGIKIGRIQTGKLLAAKRRKTNENS